MSTFRSKLAQLRRQLPFIPATVRLVWQASGFWVLVWVMLLLLQGVLPVAIVSMTKSVLDTLTAVFKKGGGNVPASSSMLLQVVVLGALLLGEKILSSVGQWIRTIQNERLQDYMTGLIHDKALELDLGYYDSPDFYDRLHRVRIDAMHRPLELLEGMGNLVQHSLTLAGMAVLLVAYAPWIPLLLLAGTIPALWVTFSYTGRLDQWWQRNIADHRRSDYFDWLIVMREAAQELRLFDLGNHYRASYQQLRAHLRGEKLGMEKRKLLSELGAEAFALMTTAFAMFWMITRTIAGLAGVGDIVLFYQAFAQGQQLMANLLRHTGEIYRNVLFLENFFDLMHTQSRISDPVAPLPVPVIKESIRFEGVEFHYPESDRQLLHDFSLTLKAGEIAAIVGENGEGKTTLIKLLCRFYDPEQGRVTVDGCDLRELRQSEWRRQVTVLFQEPVRYNVTVGENIAHGDITGNPLPADILRAADASGAYDIITRLPNGFDTLLGKWFGGAELSAGEWQRVALARAFLRNAQLIILDEPTSMLDVWAEARWFSRFRELAAGCTVLIISHRLTTTMQADVIHIMREGGITESGTHKELMNLKGSYYKAWESRGDTPSS